MILCGLDIETTGVDLEKDHVTEIAWVVVDTASPKPLCAKTFFVSIPEGFELSEEIKGLTRITERHLAYGGSLSSCLSELESDLELYGVERYVFHNGRNFDLPFLATKCIALSEPPISTLPTIDTMEDCPYPPDCRQRSLMYLAAYYGFINPFPHAALFDVMTTLKILGNFPLAHVLRRADSPSIVVQAAVPFERKDEAKARRFLWESAGGKTYPKRWVKQIKELDLEEEISGASFEIRRIGDS